MHPPTVSEYTNVPELVKDLWKKVLDDGGHRELFLNHSRPNAGTYPSLPLDGVVLRREQRMFDAVTMGQNASLLAAQHWTICMGGGALLGMTLLSIRIPPDARDRQSISGCRPADLTPMAVKQVTRPRQSLTTDGARRRSVLDHRWRGASHTSPLSVASVEQSHITKLHTRQEPFEGSVS